MDQAALYDEDIYAWSQHQARVLRALYQAGTGARLPNDLDLEHIAEEIEDLGNEQRFQVESNLGQALAHLIKVVALPPGSGRAALDQGGECLPGQRIASATAPPCGG